MKVDTKILNKILANHTQQYINKADHQLAPYTKIKSRSIKDLNINQDTIKVLDENIGRKVSDIPCKNIFTNMSPTSRDIKERINKQDYTKLKNLHIAKKTAAK